MKKSIIATLIFAIFFSTNMALYSQTKEDIFEKLRSKFQNIENISFNFKSINDPNLNGRIIAEKFNKYSITYPDRKIICDGISVWNYSKNEKQMIISKFKTNSSAAIHSIFFDILKKYHAYDLKFEVISKVTFYRLYLKSNDNEVNNLIITVSPKNEIYSLNFSIDNSSGNFRILNMKMNQKINKNTFEMKSPLGVEIIDLR